jgi:hypothetical protein
MEPITTGLLLAGGAQLLAGVGKAAGQYMSNRPLESQVERIEELKRLQEANALGLTGAEQSAYMASFVDPQRAIAAQQMQQSQALQAAMGDSGEQLRRLRTNEEQAQRAVADANRQVEMVNLQQAQLQETELRALQRDEDIREQNRQAALVGGGIQATGQALQMGSQAVAQQELISRGAMDPAAQQLGQISGYANPYGYNYNPYMQQNQMRGGNPFMMNPNLYNTYMGTPGGGQ